MSSQSALLLVVSAVLIVTGLLEVVRVRARRRYSRHTRTSRESGRIGQMLILIGGVLLIIVVATGGLGG